MMKKNYRILAAVMALMPCSTFAQGWQDNYQGVMLQGFSWDSYVDTKPTNSPTTSH